MKMNDHVTRLFEIYLLGSSQCILVVDQVFLRTALYKLGPHVSLNKMLWICPKIYPKPQEMVNSQMMHKYHGLLKEVDILMVRVLTD